MVKAREKASQRGMQPKRQGAFVPGLLMDSEAPRNSSENVLHATEMVSLRGACCFVVMP